jgi:hypothetical protein
VVLGPYVCDSFHVFLGVSASILDTCFKCFICLLCMLQLLYLDVCKVDRVLHMRCAWKVTSGACDVQDDAGDIRGSAGPLLVRSLVSPTCSLSPYAGIVRTLASPMQVPQGVGSRRKNCGWHNKHASLFVGLG